MKIVISGQRSEGKTTLAQIIAEYLKNKGYIVRENKGTIRGSRHQGSMTPRIVDIETDNSDETAWGDEMTVKPSELGSLS